MLRALLDDMPIEDAVGVKGVADLSTDDKLRILTTCCAYFIEEAVWAKAGFNKVGARAGLDALVEDMRTNLAKHIDGRP